MSDPSPSAERPWILAIGLLFTLRIADEVIGVTSLHQWAPFRPRGVEWLSLLIRGGKPGSELLSIWQRWDSLWYQYIVLHGYHAHDNSVHFEPLYPLLVRVVSVPLFGQVVLAQLLVSSVAFVFAMWLLYRLVRLDADRATAQLVVFMVALFPAGFFLLAPYTESLYLALSLACFWFMRRNEWWLAGLAGLLAALTRTVGVFLVLPLVIEYVRASRGKGKRPGIEVAATVLPAAALGLLNLYDRFVVGERLSPLEIATHWGYRTVAPWQALSDSWAHIVKTGDPVEMLNLACLAGFALVTLIGLRRLPLSYAVYVLPYLALLASREVTIVSPLESLSRYTLMLFPCFLMVGIWMARRPWFFLPWLVVTAFFQSVLLEYWVHWGFVA